MAVVESVSPSKDGLVRSCSVGYRIPKETKELSQYVGPSGRKYNCSSYVGGKWVTLTRSVQRLTLLLPVEEQIRPLTVVDNVVRDNPDKEQHEQSVDNVEKVKTVKKKVKEKWVLEK